MWVRACVRLRVSTATRTADAAAAATRLLARPQRDGLQQGRLREHHGLLAVAHVHAQVAEQVPRHERVPLREDERRREEVLAGRHQRRAALGRAFFFVINVAE